MDNNGKTHLFMEDYVGYFCWDDFAEKIGMTVG